MASADEYAAIGWADTRFADAETQTRDDFGASVQFEPLPLDTNPRMLYVAAVFGGMLIAGLTLLIVLAVRRRGSPAPT